MKTIQIDLLTFDELDATARDKALSKLSDFNLNHEWWDNVYNDFITTAGFLGITVDREKIFFSGFYSQGDGAGYSAKVDLKKLLDGISVAVWKFYAPKLELNLSQPNVDRRVLRLLCSGKTDLQPRIIKRHNRYDVVADFGGYPANEKKCNDNIWAAVDDLEQWLQGVGRTLNRFLYQSLEAEYDYLTSDEAVAQMLQANEYLFTSDGEPANRLDKLSQTINQ